MTSRTRLFVAVIVGCTLAGAPGGAATATEDRGRDTVFQYSTIDGLLAGLYDGDLMVEDIPAVGDFGLGTFNGLNGEMIVLNGTVYQAQGQGTVRVAENRTGVPFTSVTFFDADRTAPLPPGIDYPGLKAVLDTLARNQNIYQAIRIDGAFRSVRLRVAPRQAKPYVPLAQGIGRQAVFELRNVRGTLVGFRAPGYLAGLNVPGYHFHFITEDRSRGGHVFGLTTGGGTIAIDPTPAFTVSLPQSARFAALDLGKERGEDLRKVEKAQDSRSLPAVGEPVTLETTQQETTPDTVGVEGPPQAEKPVQKPWLSLFACTDDPLPAHMRLRNQRHKATHRPTGKTRRCK